MIVAGVMSGTSADGINVALVKISETSSRTNSSRKRSKEKTGAHNLSFRLLGHVEVPYPKAVRRAVLAMMNAPSARVAEMARLSFLLGVLYAEAVQSAQQKFQVRAELVGCHGQTIYHQGTPEAYLGRKLAVTWQTGEGAVVAQRLRVPVVSDFRVADLAAGGKGAPLVPFLDFMLFRHATKGRIVQNIGGIANLTAIPANAAQKDVLAFDTGPGNMVIDALAEHFLHKPYDRAGRTAAMGTVIESVVNASLKASFFLAEPPKTAGREEFGREFAARFVRACGSASKEDVLATATALTACSIADSIQRFVLRKKAGYQELIVSGGGLKNATLMAMLANAVMPMSLAVRSSDELGLPSEAKEAAAFALLAYETWHRRPSNVPSATGAKRPAVLGKVSYV
jgi:anhydro-N-acetylmuramic acid kinase